jgi:fatty acid desaturase
MAIIVPKEQGEEIKTEDSKITGEQKIKEAAQSLKKEAQEFGEKIKDKSWFRDKRNVIGLIVIFIGLVALANQFMPHWFSWSLFWALALIFIGFYIIIKR